MDCIAADGAVVVAYWARLTWGLLRLNYAATLVQRAGSTVIEAMTMWPGAEPRLASGSLAWQCNRLGVEGHWQALDPPLCRTLLAAADGKIDWHCHLPRARARVTLADGAALEGLGYVEQLDMTLRPWQLPIRELRWGRFLSEGASSVWIAWRGAQPLAMLSVNGTHPDAAEVSDAGVSWRGGRIELQTGAVLRAGTLGATALAHPVLGLIVPRVVRDIHQCKRVRRGKLIGAGRDEEGWVLDEVVRFGGDAA
jgi:hypothetical protein